MPLGLFEEAGDTIEEKHGVLEPGDRLFIYTDGIVEAEDATGEFYEEERLKAALLRSMTLPLERAREQIIREWRNHVGEAKINDDATFLLLELGEANV